MFVDSPTGRPWRAVHQAVWQIRLLQLLSSPAAAKALAWLPRHAERPGPPDEHALCPKKLALSQFETDIDRF